MGRAYRSENPHTAQFGHIKGGGGGGALRIY